MFNLRFADVQILPDNFREYINFAFLFICKDNDIFRNFKNIPINNYTEQAFVQTRKKTRD